MKKMVKGDTPQRKVLAVERLLELGGQYVLGELLEQSFQWGRTRPVSPKISCLSFSCVMCFRFLFFRLLVLQHPLQPLQPPLNLQKKQH